MTDRGDRAPEPTRNRSYGPQTYAEFMAAWEAEEMERYYNPTPLNPMAPPSGWDFDLWAEFARGVNAERAKRFGGDRA